MKPFNLEEAKAGKPVCTSDGKDVTIIKYDLRGKYPLLAIIHSPDEDGVNVCASDGRYWDDMRCPKDLFMKSEKKTGWINIYHTNPYDLYRGIFHTKETAIKSIAIDSGYVTTIQIEWEE